MGGVYENFLRVHNYELAEGVFFTTEDQTELRRVAVLGYAIVDQLFQGDPTRAVGSLIRINGNSYEVVGTLKRSDSWEGDNQIFIPYRTAMRFTLGDERMSWPQLTAIVTDLKLVEEGVEQIKQVLAGHYEGATPDSFFVYDMDRQLRSAQRADLVMTLMLVAVASMVLLVGGIGIMNVLLVSIKERTKEIGILKAIGTRRRDILLQFLLQAIFISLAGGVMGVALSYAATPLVKRFSEMYTPSLLGAYVSLGFALITGTFFGYYPARKAATLRPIEALNDE